MKRTLTQIRCVPRFGYAHTNVRLVELDGGAPDEPDQLLIILQRWFEFHEIPDAVYAIEHDDDGFFAVVNDEAYHADWGEPLL